MLALWHRPVTLQCHLCLKFSGFAKYALSRNFTQQYLVSDGVFIVCASSIDMICFSTDFLGT